MKTSSSITAKSNLQPRQNRTGIRSGRIRLPGRCLGFIALLLALLATAYGQLTPSQDAYVNSASPTSNFGAKTLLDVDGASQITYIQFNLASIPPGASITQATLKLYVNSVTAAGSFNVDYVNSAWSEGSINWNNAPPLGSTIAASVPVVTADKNQYLLINVTSALQAWLNGSETNNGVAIVANGSTNMTFDSKENTTTSHPAELDVVFTSGQGTITGVLTGSGSGLMGGGTSGTLNLSLTNTCASGQVLSWNGSAWVCTSVGGTGTVTSVGLSAPSSDFVVSGSPVTTSGTLNFGWNVAPTNAATPGAIVKRDADGGFNANYIVLNSTTTFPITAGTTAPNGSGLYAYNGATSGNGTGVTGITDSTATNSYGVYGLAAASSGTPVGVYGLGTAYYSPGVWGQNGTESGTGTSFTGRLGSGVWGDGGGYNVGVTGTTDEYVAGYFINNSTVGYDTLLAEAVSSASNPFVAIDDATGGECYIDGGGNLNCTGSKNAVVPIDGGARTVAMSAIESPKNWFEDFGSAQLVNGAAVVALDTEFTQTVNTGQEYQVFLTPYGDCKGLYVSNRTANSFEVHELGGGSASLSFGYRITALRRNYEGVRFADHTHDLDSLKQMRERMKMNHPQGQSHDPAQKAVPTFKSVGAPVSPVVPTTSQAVFVGTPKTSKPKK
jgi:hypothetical protein